MAKKKSTPSGVKALAGKVADALTGKPVPAKKQPAPKKQPPARKVKMTRVRMLQSVSGTRFSFHANQLAALPAEQAAEFVRCGFAERIPAAAQVKADHADLKKRLAAAEDTVRAQAETIQELHEQITALTAPPAAAEPGEDQPELEV